MLSLVGLGGTFDHLHEGHQLLLRTALNVSEKIVIGLTTEKLLKNKKHFELIEDYQTRERNLLEYLKTLTDLSRVEIVPLDDPYGPPIHQENFEGLIASQETYPNALKINEIREQKGFKPLILVVIPIIKKDDQIISSTLIRENLSK